MAVGIKNINDAFECGICWESHLRDLVETDCGHHFDPACLFPFFATQMGALFCPMDRNIVVLTKEQLGEVWQLRLVRINQILSEINPYDHQLEESAFHLREQEVVERYDQALQEGNQTAVECILSSNWGKYPAIARMLLNRTLRALIFTPEVRKLGWTQAILAARGNEIYEVAAEIFQEEYGEENYTPPNIIEFGRKYRVCATWGLIVAIESGCKEMFEELLTVPYILDAVLRQLLPHFADKREWFENFQGAFYSRMLGKALTYSLRHNSTEMSDWVRDKLGAYCDAEFFLEQLLSECIVAQELTLFREMGDIACVVLGKEKARGLLNRLKENLPQIVASMQTSGARK